MQMDGSIEALELSDSEWVVVEERATATAANYSGVRVAKALQSTSTATMRLQHKSWRLQLFEPLLFYGDSSVVYACPDRGPLLVASGEREKVRAFYFEQVRKRREERSCYHCLVMLFGLFDSVFFLSRRLNLFRVSSNICLCTRVLRDCRNGVSFGLSILNLLLSSWNGRSMGIQRWRDASACCLRKSNETNMDSGGFQELLLMSFQLICKKKRSHNFFPSEVPLSFNFKDIVVVVAMLLEEIQFEFGTLFTAEIVFPSPMMRLKKFLRMQLQRISLENLSVGARLSFAKQFSLKVKLRPTYLHVCMQHSAALKNNVCKLFQHTGKKGHAEGASQKIHKSFFFL